VIVSRTYSREAPRPAGHQSQGPAHKVETCCPDEVDDDTQICELEGLPQVRPAGPRLEPAADLFGEVHYRGIDVRHHAPQLEPDSMLPLIGADDECSSF
jgi:hypothetical protein